MTNSRQDSQNAGGRNLTVSMGFVEDVYRTVAKMIGRSPDLWDQDGKVGGVPGSALEEKIPGGPSRNAWNEYRSGRKKAMREDNFEAIRLALRLHGLGEWGVDSEKRIVRVNAPVALGSDSGKRLAVQLAGVALAKCPPERVEELGSLIASFRRTGLSESLQCEFLEHFISSLPGGPDDSADGPDQPK